MLYSETKKLEIQIDNALHVPSKLDISQIIPIYHRVLNISSLVRVFKQFFKNTEPKDESKTLINETEKLIFEKFNSTLHLNFSKQLSDSINDSVNELKTQKNFQKIETEIKSDAALYDKLRELMSTKEFVDQYDQGLSND